MLLTWIKAIQVSIQHLIAFCQLGLHTLLAAFKEQSRPFADVLILAQHGIFCQCHEFFNQGIFITWSAKTVQHHLQRITWVTAKVCLDGRLDVLQESQ